MKMRNVCLLIVSLFIGQECGAQHMADSVHSLAPVVVVDSIIPINDVYKDYPGHIISERSLEMPETNLLMTMNNTQGVRMEERSPGSYRLSIRGSLLRSTFGIRNVKMYFEDIPITDASGNTYLNLFDPEVFDRFTIYFGPQDNGLGSNTGGAMEFYGSTESRRKKTDLNLDLLGGQYGLFKLFAKEEIVRSKWQLNVAASYQQQDGYRANSNFKRSYFQAIPQWQYAKSARLKLIAVYSDLQYHTPGGLTKAQWDADARAARPATATLPGAITQQAAIYNKTFIGGLVNEWNIRPRLKHVIAISDMRTDFRNPFITNYEVRNENTYSLRTYLLDTLMSKDNFTWKLNGGWEGQIMQSDIANYDNDKGEKGKQQSNDKITSSQQFFWLQSSWKVQKLTVNLSANYGSYGYDYPTQFPTLQSKETKRFDPQLMPHLFVAYSVNNHFRPFARVCRGYSSPTLEEVRASNQQINTNVQAESGWTYEAGVQLSSKSERLFLEIKGYSFRLDNTIVRRLLPNEDEYYVNAGNSRQLGLEVHLQGNIVSGGYGFLDRLVLNAYYTGNDYHFGDYIIDSNNYSGNRITGVPQHTIVFSAEGRMKERFRAYVQYTYTSNLPLDDANKTFAKPYHLLQAKLSYRILDRSKFKTEIYIAGDNLLNQRYSLGNDLNAIGGRYYNPAPAINFYGGVRFAL